MQKQIKKLCSHRACILGGEENNTIKQNIQSRSNSDKCGGGKQGRGLGRVCVAAVLNRLVREGCPKTQCLSRDLKNVKE